MLAVLRSKLKTKGSYAFEVVEPTCWNALLVDLRSVVSHDSFKRHVRTHLFEQAFVLAPCVCIFRCVYVSVLCFIFLYDVLCFIFLVKHFVTHSVKVKLPRMPSGKFTIQRKLLNRICFNDVDAV